MEESQLYWDQSSHNEGGQRRRPTLKDCPTGWLLLKILPCSDPPDLSRNLCIPNFLVKLAHSTRHSHLPSILLQDLQELAALLGQEDRADPRLVMGKAEGPGKQGQFSHQYQKCQPACLAEVTGASALHISKDSKTQTFDRSLLSLKY